MMLDGKTPIVTAAGSRVGRAVALACSREGVAVVASDVSHAAGQETVHLVQQATPGARCIHVHADAARAEDHESLVRTAVDGLLGPTKTAALDSATRGLRGAAGAA